MLISRNDLNKVNIVYKDKNISFSIDVAIRTSVTARPGDQDIYNYNFSISKLMVKYDYLNVQEFQWDSILNYMFSVDEWKKAILGKSIKSVNIPSNSIHEESLKNIITLTT